MRAVSYKRTGDSDVLQVGEIETPEPGPGQVRVKIAVSGVNPTDWRARSGQTGQVPEIGFQIPGQDGAGTIDAVGEGVDPARMGERVWVYLSAGGSPWGTAAEYCVVPSDRAVALDDGASFELGASLGVPAMTAHRCLFADGPLDGKGVLVAGGAGAVGHAAVELAVAAGATVVATASGEQKARLARDAGAHHVVNYRDPDAAEQIRAVLPDGVARVVEVDLAANLELDLAVIANGAAIVTYGQTGGTLDTATVRTLKTLNTVLRFVLLYQVPPEALAQAARDITRAVADQALTTLPLTRFPLEQTADAQDAVEAGITGKVLIDVV